MDRLLSGIGDGCDSCLTPRRLWTDIETIEEGFPKNRTFENIRETWDSLAKDKDGEVVKRTGDYETRKGQCHEPLTLRETLSFSMTHKVSLNIGLFITIGIINAPHFPLTTLLRFSMRESAVMTLSFLVNVLHEPQSQDCGTSPDWPP